MKQNKYDDEIFFQKYSQMERSVAGLSGAGEWETLRPLLPDFHGLRLLDLGCGFGWHCQYAMAHGASQAVGVDISARMLEEARRKNQYDGVTYHQLAIEDIDYPPESFDCVLSSLAFHYLASFTDIAAKVYDLLTDGGRFIFSVEHPVFTAYGSQDWVYDDAGGILHFPVDRYFVEGPRQAIFLGEAVTKYHRTLTTYVQGLLGCGFVLTAVQEPQPSPALLAAHPEMQNELRRPMMLIISATKPENSTLLHHA